MSELDGLIDSKISLISQEDVKFDGTLFSINAEESSMVLKDVQCLGTEDRVTDPAKMVAGNSVIIPFVTFPGQEIKDLIVHDPAPVAQAPPVAPKQQQQQQQRAPQQQQQQQQRAPRVNPPRPPAPANQQGQDNRPKRQPQAQNQPPVQNQQAGQAQQQQQQQAPRREPRSNTDGPSAGTGAHLLKLREKRGTEGGAVVAKAEPVGEFDFSVGLDMFKKNEVGESEEVKEVKYKKDDFFDSLSCDIKDRQEGRKTRMSASEERSLNQDTFGAIALQGNNRRYFQGGRGGGQGGQGGAGRSGRGTGGGRGGGRGRGRSYGNGGVPPAAAKA